MVNSILQFLSGFSAEVKLIIVSMLPIIELRGAIPIGIAFGLPAIKTFFICLLGSLIPSPFILFGVRPIFSYLRKTKTFRNMVNKLSDNTLRKSRRIKKYGFWGLLLFVAIPLPGTGVWSGTLAAVLLDTRFKVAFPAIILGNIIAGILITLLSYNILTVF